MAIRSITPNGMNIKAIPCNHIKLYTHEKNKVYFFTAFFI